MCIFMIIWSKMIDLILGNWILKKYWKNVIVLSPQGSSLSAFKSSSHLFSVEDFIFFIFLMSWSNGGILRLLMSSIALILLMIQLDKLVYLLGVKIWVDQRSCFSIVRNLMRWRESFILSSWNVYNFGLFAILNLLRRLDWSLKLNVFMISWGINFRYNSLMILSWRRKKVFLIKHQ